MNSAERYIIGLVGPGTARERAVVAGRFSATRRLAASLGEERFLPQPPPLDQDATLASELDRAGQQIARVNRSARAEARRIARAGKGGATSPESPRA